MLRSMQSDHEEHVEDGGANNGAKSNVVLGLDARRMDEIWAYLHDMSIFCQKVWFHTFS